MAGAGIFEKNYSTLTQKNGCMDRYGAKADYLHVAGMNGMAFCCRRLYEPAHPWAGHTRSVPANEIAF
jgi:hypothetical protein